MNLVVDRREEWRGEHEAFQGPGLYGVFLDRALFYIGLYAEKKDRPFGGSVFERWHKHIAYQIARSPYLSFTPEGMGKIIADKGVIGTAFAQMLEASGISLGALDAAVHPLIAKRNRNGSRTASCTPSKIRFAEQHWSSKFGPDATRDTLDALMARFEFVYQQWPRGWVGRVAPGPGQRPGDWVLTNWLAEPEAKLIGDYAPVCNHPAVAPAPANEHPVTPDVLEQRLADIVAPLGAKELPPAQALIREEGEREEPDEAEERFRAVAAIARWSETLISDLQSSCPSAFDVYFTNNDDLRIGLKQPYARPVAAAAPSRCSLLSQPASGRASSSNPAADPRRAPASVSSRPDELDTFSSIPTGT